MVTNWTYVFFSYLSLFLLGLSDNIRGPLLADIMQKFALSHTQASLIFVISSSMGFISSLIASVLISQFTILKVLALSCFILSFGFSIMWVANNFFMFLLGIGFFGFSMGLMSVSQNIMGSLSATGAVRDRVVSGLHSMYGLASLLAPLLVVAVVFHFKNWQDTFLVISILGILTAFMILYGKEKNQSNLTRPINDEPISSFKYKSSDIWRDSFILASYVGAELLISSRIAIFTMEVYKYDFSSAANLTSLFFIFLLLGRLYFTLFKSPLKTKSALYTSLGTSLVLLFLGLNYDPRFLSLTGLTMSLYYPFCISFLSNKYSGDIKRILSTSMISQSLVILIMHLLVGHFSDLFGVKKALFLGFFLLVIPVLILFFEKKSEVIHG